MDAVLFFIADRPHFVNRLTDNVHDPAQGLAANRCADLLAGIDNSLATLETVGGVHGDGTHRVFTQMLSNFKHQVVLTVINGRVGHFQGVINLRQLTGLKLDVNNCADNL